MPRGCEIAERREVAPRFDRSVEGSAQAMESERREATDDGRDAEDGDISVPANAAVAANVLAGGSSAEQDAETDQDN